MNFERNRNPREALGLKLDIAEEKNKIKNSLGSIISSDYDEKDDAFYFILLHNYIKEIGKSLRSKKDIIEAFENSPFKFIKFQRMNTNKLKLIYKSYDGDDERAYRVIVKFKIR